MRSAGRAISGIGRGPLKDAYPWIAGAWFPRSCLRRVNRSHFTPPQKTLVSSGCPAKLFFGVVHSGVGSSQHASESATAVALGEVRPTRIGVNMSILAPLIRQLGRLAVLVCLCVLAASAQQSAVRIGMVLDGPAEQNARLLEIFEYEITVLVEGEFQVELPAAKQLVADWTAAGIAGAVDGLLSDPDVDYIVTLGILGSNDVSRRGPLPKPVFAAIILDPEIQGIPSEMLGQPVIGEELEQFKVSGVPNLSYVTAGGDAVQEIRVFRGLVPFSRLTILYMEALSNRLDRADR